MRLGPARALRACLEHLAAGPARLVLVDPVDLWGQDEPHNRPGTGGEEPNFRRRWARIWPDDLAGASAVVAGLRRVARARGDRGGPAPAHPPGRGRERT